MKFEIRKYNCSDSAAVLLNNKIQQNHVKERIPTRPKKGLHLERKGAAVNVVFSCEMEDSGLHNAFLRLSRREIFLLAKLFKDGKSDEEFLAAIIKQE